MTNLTTNTTRELAEAIYSECYGHLDDKYHAADKTQEIQDWLNDGDTAEVLAQTAQQLAAEWREYAAGDKNIKLAAAAAIGRLGGRSTSPAKRAAASTNGKRGGRIPAWAVARQKEMMGMLRVDGPRALREIQDGWEIYTSLYDGEDYIRRVE